MRKFFSFEHDLYQIFENGRTGAPKRIHPHRCDFSETAAVVLRNFFGNQPYMAGFYDRINHIFLTIILRSTGRSSGNFKDDLVEGLKRDALNWGKRKLKRFLKFQG